MRLSQWKTVSALVVAAAALTGSASAATISFGVGSAVSAVDATADFENPASLLSGPYVENGLQFTRVDLTDNNNGCGFAGCSNAPGFFPGFSGNYYYGVGDGYIDILTTGGALFKGLEFVAGTGFFTPAGEIESWEAFRGGTLVGSGTFAFGAPLIVGFSDSLGFNDLRYASLLSDLSAPAIDSVRAEFVQTAPVPEPASLALLGTGLLAVAIRARRRR